MSVKHHMGYFLKNTILSLNHSSLIGSSRGWKFMFYSLKVTKVIDFYIIKLSPPITPNSHNGMPFLYLNFSAKRFNCSIFSKFSLKK